jgi:protein TonB
MLEGAFMFEESLVESRVFAVSSSKRWTAMTSIGLQLSLAVLVIALPLFHPEELPFRTQPPKVALSLLAKPPIPVVVHETRTASSSLPETMTLPTMARQPAFTSLLPLRDAAEEDAPPIAATGGMTLPGGLPTGLGIGGEGHSPSISVAPARMEPLRISSGISQGMLIAPIRPVYPSIAKAAHVEGAVVVEAVISQTGTIESLQVVSGPAMLRNAAVEAIHDARYKPYRLNGQATEVRTTITINFRMGG